MIPPEVIIFDGDDTLWWTEPLYDAARSSVAKRLAERGLDPVEWDQIERVLDVQNVSRFGLTTARFPTSCVEAYEHLATRSGLCIDPTVRDEVASIARSVFSEVAPVVNGASQVLETLASETSLALLTRGDPQVQTSRIEHSGLGRWFRTIEIVSEKSPECFTAILRGIGGESSRSWSVGNSLRSDIEPALKIGMRAIWINAYVWDFERVAKVPDHEGLFAVESLQDVPTVLRREAVPMVSIDGQRFL